MTEAVQEGLDLAAGLPDDEAAFEAGFNGTEVEVVVDTPVVEAPAEEPAVEEPVAEESTAEEPAVEPAAEEPVAEPPRLIAGLTEDQIVSALAKTSQLQSAVDKINGKMGNLMQRLEAVANAPKTAAEQRAFDLKLEKLSETFPELADILREDLKAIGVPAPVEQAPVAPAFTQEDVDRLVQSRLETFQQQQMVAQQVTALGVVHPDWEQVIRTPEFAVWRDNVIDYGAQLMESEDAAFISKGLSDFKAWKAAKSAPPPQAAPAPSARLRNAVLPSTRSAPVTGPVTEDDAFEAGFASYNKNF